ncbi:MAG: purine-nucleoside phosphorylase [Myxococcales bacterium]|nr:purine-nucleoside phosphorylase [Myxococcales bacterium]
MTHPSDLRARLDAATASIRARDARAPDIALVLGSGLSPFADTLVDATVIPYPEIAHMPVVTVPGHAGKLVLGKLPGAPDGPVVAALAGRVHFYEGHPMDTVVFATRMLISLGAKTVVLTNAAGGISPTCRPGDLVLISDHLNMQGTNPLIGHNDPTLGPRFPDMTRVYDPALRALAQSAAAAEGTELREGVYVGLTGPSYETPAEIRMFRALGADLVGMSTVPEAIAARHMGARVLGISCVTNLAAGVSATELSHEEVEHTAKATRERFIRVVRRTLVSIGKAER